jgi:hypothetical protein
VACDTSGLVVALRGQDIYDKTHEIDLWDTVKCTWLAVFVCISQAGDGIGAG